MQNIDSPTVATRDSQLLVVRSAKLLLSNLVQCSLDLKPIYVDSDCGVVVVSDPEVGGLAFLVIRVLEQLNCHRSTF